MKTTISTKNGTHNWGDAHVGDYLVINDNRHRVARVDDQEGVCAFGMALLAEYWQALGAHLERDVEEYPHGVLRHEPGEVIRLLTPIADLWQRGASLAFGEPWGSDIGSCTDEEMQRLADAHGFTRLVPESEVEAARVEGWKQGIREAHQAVRSAFHAAEIEDMFPEVFEQEGGDES